MILRSTFWLGAKRPTPASEAGGASGAAHTPRKRSVSRRANETRAPTQAAYVFHFFTTRQLSRQRPALAARAQTSSASFTPRAKDPLLGPEFLAGVFAEATVLVQQMRRRKRRQAVRAVDRTTHVRLLFVPIQPPSLMKALGATRGVAHEFGLVVDVLLQVLEKASKAFEYSCALWAVAVTARDELATVLGKEATEFVLHRCDVRFLRSA